MENFIFCAVITTAQMCMKINMAKKKYQNNKVNSNFDRNFGSSPPKVY